MERALRLSSLGHLLQNCSLASHCITRGPPTETVFLAKLVVAPPLTLFGGASVTDLRTLNTSHRNSKLRAPPSRKFLARLRSTRRCQNPRKAFRSRLPKP